MDALKQLLEDRGLNFEQLDETERNLYMKWYSELANKELTLDDVRGFIRQIRETVSVELATHDLSTRGIFSFIFFWRKNKDLFLKARLKNLIILEAMMDGPAKAKKAIEAYIKALPKGA